ncbi:hypothetical protein MUU72_01385 [Streptomyces sp. RS10V-4]|uniref:hypothetical protein n=1 Tax=Streptomyces rhizoryzae TaxID=2932493 RepID=UPI002004C4B9|nr:hypothetical protein [Streptomyces rhizoryzae]MCK7621793.1 hypothetical protein [Streptomyces rhizoryzae]
MAKAHAYGGYRTGGLWIAAGASFGGVVVGSGLALFGMLEFDEQCAQGLIRGPGRFLHARDRAFPPATVCEFEQGEVVSPGGQGVLSVLLWAGLLVLVGCLLTALVAECLDPDPRRGGGLVVPMTRAEKLRRTGTAFFVTGSAFLLCYAAAAWRLFAGPSSACAAGADWGTQAPRTLEYGFLPPQATCQYTSGLTRPLNPDWLAALATESAVPAALAGIGFALAWRRRRAERRASPAGTGR